LPASAPPFLHSLFSCLRVCGSLLLPSRGLPRELGEDLLHREPQPGKTVPRCCRSSVLQLQEGCRPRHEMPLLLKHRSIASSFPATGNRSLQRGPSRIACNEFCNEGKITRNLKGKSCCSSREAELITASTTEHPGRRRSQRKRSGRGEQSVCSPLPDQVSGSFQVAVSIPVTLVATIPGTRLPRSRKQPVPVESNVKPAVKVIQLDIIRSPVHFLVTEGSKGIRLLPLLSANVDECSSTGIGVTPHTARISWCPDTRTRIHLLSFHGGVQSHG